jgi:hypothetical protein
MKITHAAPPINILRESMLNFCKALIITSTRLVFVLFAKLPDSTVDLSPWNHWRMPVVVEEVEAHLRPGPVLGRFRSGQTAVVAPASSTIARAPLCCALVMQESEAGIPRVAREGG